MRWPTDKRWISLVVLVAFGTGACARPAVVPLDVVFGSEPLEGRYRIHTTDGRVIESDEVERTSSSLIINSQLVGGKRVHGDRLVLSMEDIESVHRMETDRLKTTLLVAGIVIVAGGLVVAWAFASALSNLD
jgi:hypothetical protein